MRRTVRLATKRPSSRSTFHWATDQRMWATYPWRHRLSASEPLHGCRAQPPIPGRRSPRPVIRSALRGDQRRQTLALIAVELYENDELRQAAKAELTNAAAIIFSMRRFSATASRRSIIANSLPNAAYSLPEEGGSMVIVSPSTRSPRMKRRNHRADVRRDHKEIVPGIAHGDVLRLAQPRRRLALAIGIGAAIERPCKDERRGIAERPLAKPSPRSSAPNSSITCGIGKLR